MREDGEWVFGYGSLVDPSARSAVLRGYRRHWGVAMDNAVDLPGYKHYVLPSGERPPVLVCFLDLLEDRAATVRGSCLPVDAALLAALDRRERNYARIDVTSAVDPRPPGRVWTYVGTPEARARAQRARERGRAVVASCYFDRLEATEPPDIPIWRLSRVDLS